MAFVGILPFCINIGHFATYHRNVDAKIAHSLKGEVVLVTLVAVRRAMAFVPFAFEHSEPIDNRSQPKKQIMDYLGSTIW